VKPRFAREPGYPSAVDTAFRKAEFRYQIVLARSEKPSSSLAQDTAQKTAGVTHVRGLLTDPGRFSTASLGDS